MAVSEQLASLNPVVKSGGTVYVNFEDGSQLEFADAGAFSAYILDRLSRETARVVLLGHLLAKDPLLDSPGDWAGKKLTIDAEQALFANVVKLATVVGA